MGNYVDLTRFYPRVWVLTGLMLTVDVLMGMFILE
jgi:hypothetical protein